MDILTEKLNDLKKEIEYFEQTIKEKEEEKNNKYNSSIATIEELLKEQDPYFDLSVVGRSKEIYIDPITNIKIITNRDKLENAYKHHLISRKEWRNNTKFILKPEGLRNNELFTHVLGVLKTQQKQINNLEKMLEDSYETLWK